MNAFTPAFQEPVDLLTQRQFFELMRMYGAECGFDYPLYGLKDMYAHYRRGLWPIAVSNAIKMFANFESQCVAQNRILREYK